MKVPESPTAAKWEWARQPLRSLTSAIVVLDRTDIDTDQIIPARYLKTTAGDGLSSALFADWRFRPDGTPDPACPLNQPGSAAAQILVAGSNFGCGSSREHAAWALRDFGFRIVISDRIADIFTSNAVRNGILPACIDAATHRRLLSAHRSAITVDLETSTLTLADGSAASFRLDAFARRCLLDGIDELGYLLSRHAAIARHEEASCKP